MSQLHLTFSNTHHAVNFFVNPPENGRTIFEASMPESTLAHPISACLLTMILFCVSLFSACAQTQQDVAFCPEDGCADRLINEIHGSTQYAHVAIAYFTDDRISDALIEAYQRGVDVQVLGEGSQNYPGTDDYSAGMNYDVVQQLKQAGVPYRDDSNPAIMHDKFTIIDGVTVLTGSYNYTVSADTQNNENLVILTSDRMAEAFETEFQNLWSNGVE